MTWRKQPLKFLVLSLITFVLALLCAFFIFYEIRLLYVTKGLTGIRPGGQGVYIGAIAFPVLALLFGLGAWRLFRAAQQS